RRWLEAAVVGLGLCPFAKPVLDAGRLHLTVSAARDEDAALADLQTELQALADLPASTRDTTLLVLPHLWPDFLDFNQFLDATDALLEALELDGIFQIAPFHPGFVFAGEPEDDMSHCTNRSPYPTLHLLREDSLAEAIESYAARRGDTDRIYEQNIRHLRGLGVAGWQTLFSHPKV
ncbi:DUF1415 domain-containing protein, partial [Amphibiibacter pelophylacis]